MLKRTVALHKCKILCYRFVIVIVVFAVIIISNILILNKSEEQIQRKPTKQTRECKYNA